VPPREANVDRIIRPSKGTAGHDDRSMYRECAVSCLSIITHLLIEGGALATPAHIQRLLDCARLCGVAGELVAGGSEFDSAALRLCAEACERCARECARGGENPQLMQEFAALCRRCAQHCRETRLIRV